MGLDPNLVLKQIYVHFRSGVANKILEEKEKARAQGSSKGKEPVRKKRKRYVFWHRLSKIVLTRMTMMMQVNLPFIVVRFRFRHIGIRIRRR